jgi:hypothetical protein
VLSNDGDIDDHSVRRADRAQALARWRHIVALHEATNTLHWAMCLAPYLPGGMVIAIAIISVTFYYIVVIELKILPGY